MARPYSEIAKTAKESWSPEAHALAAGAAKAFGAEVDAHRALGGVFEAARRGAGFTQAELAARSGIGQAEISKIERGLGNPTSGTLLKIAGAMGLALALVPAKEAAAGG